ncbi:MAG: hypothetical protein OEX02_18555 [Cyclobacteriaceae bacterium]|nr:hypothetical protein [Cyclobacteriaceae bacterium]
MSKINITIYILFIWTLNSCRISYLSDDAKERIPLHSIIAIAPPKLNVSGYPLMKDEKLLDLYYRESFNFQKSLLFELNEKRFEGKLNIKIQDPDQTNLILEEFLPFKVHLIEPEDLCKILQVDAVIISEYTVVKPTSVASSIVSASILGQPTTTNFIEVDLNIHDQKSSYSCWSYKNRAAGNFFTPLPLLLSGLLNDVSREIPYARKKIKW